MTIHKDDVRVGVRWKDALRFEADLKNDRSLDLDGDSQQGPSPMEALLSSLCGCMTIDVVMILQKMRVDLQGLELLASGQREAEPPRFFNAIELEFRTSGTVPRDKLERAIRLSFQKYCSVFHTLRPDIDLSWSVSPEQASPRAAIG